LDIWQKFKGGDSQAFAALYELHIQDLINFGYRVVSDRSQIEDAIQDLFVELWHSRQSLTDVRNVKAYLFATLRNKLLRIRKLNTHERLTDTDFVSGTPLSESHESAWVDQESHEQQIALLAKVIGVLPKRQQEVIELRYYHNFTNEEIAGIMGVHYQSVCNLLSASLKILRKELRIFISFALLLLSIMF